MRIIVPRIIRASPPISPIWPEGQVAGEPAQHLPHDRQSFQCPAHWDNPKGDRYTVELEIISVELNIDGETSGNALPLIEILKTNIVDRKTGERIDGIVGNNFSSYVRDYDFSVLLLEHNKDQAKFSTPEDFGDLHGKLFRLL